MVNRLANLTACGIVQKLLFLALLFFISGRECLAQNDWQYPDPYFGILEIEKSVDSASSRRWRGERVATPKPLPSIRGQRSKRPGMRGRSQTVPQLEKKS